VGRGPAATRRVRAARASRGRAGGLAATALALLVLAGEAPAHTKSASWSRWEIDADGARAQLRIPAVELTRLPPGTAFPEYFAARLTLLAGGRPWAPGAPSRDAGAPEGWAVFRWRAVCPGPGPPAIRSEILREVAPSHLHFTRVALPAGDVREGLLVERSPLLELEIAGAGTRRGANGGARGASLGGYVALGVEHILTGTDHLAFVLALLLLSRSLREVATLVTAFTAAHSLTLALAVLGALRPEPRSIEILIGFSIALVAAENAWLLGGKGRLVPAGVAGGAAGAAALAAAGMGALAPLAWLGLALFSLCHFGLLARARRPAALRAAVAFVFGLAHGFGFAGALMEAELPPDRLAPALFGFNAGVELGQLAVVGAAWPALALLARAAGGRWHRLVAETGSAAIFALGVFWIVSRTWA
jgi:hypothetical protein